MEDPLILVLIIAPVFFAGLVLLFRTEKMRRTIIAVFSLLMLAASIVVFRTALANGGFAWSREVLPFDPAWLIRALDVAVFGYVIYTGFRLRHVPVIALASVQLLLLAGFELFGGVKEPGIALRADYLSVIMVLLVSLIGPLIAIFATGYMKGHESHLKLFKSAQPRFFAILLVFLGAMNGLVLADNLLWLYFFWEVTTLCSFLLISHDGNETSVKNASRALWINLLGGLAFLVAIIALYKQLGTVSLSEIIDRAATSGLTGLMPFGVALLCLAGFTKAAQFPFQSWLLGAMVAPTPVSALLHSSTMVKAGVYIVVRLSPAIGGTLPGTVLAAVGGFTFMAGSAMAISQTNSKSVLAYSTIANLGLIICCAGIGTHVAVGAAMLLIIFHAFSKALLFLCVGTIELEIGSRDIEDMQGLMKRMPFTTIVTVLGMISMLLPPFGVLMTKWLAIEAAVRLPAVLVLIILGSAFTVVFWAKWIGIMLTMSYKSRIQVEKLAFSMKSVLSLLIAGVLALSLCTVYVYNALVLPQLDLMKIGDTLAIEGRAGGLWVIGETGFLTGGFISVPLFLILFLLMFSIPLLLFRARPERIKPPYVGGELANHDIRGIEFIGPMDRVENAVVHNYYFSGILSEGSLTLIFNSIAAAIILVMFGVVLW